MKRLYYIENIRNVSLENDIREVTLFDATSEENSNAITINLESNALFYRNSRGKSVGLSPNSYVYYDAEGQQTFENGNLDRFARRMRALASWYLRQIIQSNANYRPELPGEQFFAHANEELIVRSFHVNVGHGNCTLILTIRRNFYQLWCIDCSVYDYMNHQNYSQNVEECMTEVSNLTGVPVYQLRISYFMLTHTHYDHFSGLEFLFSKGYVNRSTVFYANIHYGCVSSSWVRVLKLFATHQCHVVEPLRNMHPVMKVLFPEIRQVSKARNNSAVPYRIVSSPNNSSVVYSITIAGKSMILPGDLEQSGLQEMMKQHACSPDYCYSTYYCVSHHASAIGHIDIPCIGTRVFPTPLICVRQNLRYAIVMGRDGAFPGIYAPNVTTDFAHCIVYSEKDNNGNPVKYLELNWLTNTVAYH